MNVIKKINIILIIINSIDVLLVIKIYVLYADQNTIKLITLMIGKIEIPFANYIMNLIFHIVKAAKKIYA